MFHLHVFDGSSSIIWQNCHNWMHCLLMQATLDLSPNRSILPQPDRDYGVGHLVEFPSASRNQRYCHFLYQISGSNSLYFPQLTSFCSPAAIFPAWEWTCLCLSLPAQARCASLSRPTEAAYPRLLIQLTLQEQSTMARTTTPSTIQGHATTWISGQISRSWGAKHPCSCHHTVLQEEDNDPSYCTLRR